MIQVGGHSAHSGGGGTVGSGDRAFCIVTLAALDLDTGLNECSSERSDQPSIDMVFVANNHKGKLETEIEENFYWYVLWYV